MVALLHVVHVSSSATNSLDGCIAIKSFAIIQTYTNVYCALCLCAGSVQRSSRKKGTYKPLYMDLPDSTWQPPTVTFDTTIGTFGVELYWQHAPQTCRNIAELTRRGYYDNTVFHRIIPDFMIQGGDPTGTGRGGQSIYGPQFADEIHPELRHTGAGVLSMANSGPDTNGSQFFITLAPTQWLDGKHAIFGRIYSGMDVVKKMGMVQTDKNDRPVMPIKILKGRVNEK